MSVIFFFLDFLSWFAKNTQNLQIKVVKFTHQSGWNKRRNGLEIADGACVGAKEEIDGEEHNSQQTENAAADQTPNNILSNAGLMGN